MAKRKLVDPFAGKKPLLANLEEVKMKVEKIEVVKRGKGELDPNTTPMNYVHKQFIEVQKGRGNTPKTITYYENAYKQLMNFLIDELPSEEMLKEIKEANAQADFAAAIPVSMLEMDNIEIKYRNYLLNIAGVNEVTVDTKFRAFRAFSYYCMDEGWIAQRKIKVKNTLAPIKECYTHQEVKALLKKPTTDDYIENRNWVIVNYLLSSGNRVSSIVNLNIEDVDLEEGYIFVNTQKNRIPARVALIDKMCSILREYIYDYREEDKYGNPIPRNKPLFCNRFGERLTESGLYKSIAEYNDSRGVNKASIHLFRHTFAKDWIIRGGDLFSLQKMLGHSSLKMVQHYSNLYSSDVKAKAEQFSMLANMPTTSGETIKKRGKDIIAKRK